MSKRRDGHYDLHVRMLRNEQAYHAAIAKRVAATHPWIEVVTQFYPRFDIQGEVQAHLQGMASGQSNMIAVKSL